VTRAYRRARVPASEQGFFAPYLAETVDLFRDATGDPPKLILSLMQLLWDRGEADGYAQHMTGDPLPPFIATTLIGGRGHTRR
jgi:hypothetical protein